MVTRAKRIAGIASLYLVMITIVIWMTFQARSAVMTSVAASPRAQAEWTKWREDVESGAVPDDGAVSRRTPKSTEPPWLVLMRDHFAVCLTAAIVFSSLLFAVTAFFVAAVARTR
jgi:hypothetical protein